MTNLTSTGSRKVVISNRSKKLRHHRREDTKSDLDPLEHMESQRRLQSAEQGQLLPRSRRHTDMTSSPLAQSISDSDDSDDSASRAVSWPSRHTHMNIGKQLSRRIERMEGPQPIPFRAFVESMPPARPPPSAWTSKTQSKFDAVRTNPTPKSRNTSSGATPGHTPISSTSSTSLTVSIPSSASTESLSIANTRARKINKGFEILPAGTLDRERPEVKDFGTPTETPPARKTSKKLQKRCRSNSESRRISRESQRLSNDGFRLSIF
jgi:hypothetical protein